METIETKICSTCKIELPINSFYFRKESKQSLFSEGMTWDNWSLNGWHIDHKIPLSWFNLENINCQKIAFHYTNMKPMWGKDNIAKNNRYADTLNNKTWMR